MCSVSVVRIEQVAYYALSRHQSFDVLNFADWHPLQLRRIAAEINCHIDHAEVLGCGFLNNTCCAFTCSLTNSAADKS